VRQRLSRILGWLEDLASRRLGALVLFVVALAVYAFEAIGWPLVGGRDLDEYLYEYIQFLDWHPLLPWSMLFRTPAMPIFAGLSLDAAGGFFVEPLWAVLFAGSIVAWAAAARAFGARAALLVSVALLVFPAYALLYHELSSDALFGAAFALWAWLVVRAAMQPTTGRFALAGVGVALCSLVRPGNALLLAFALIVVAVRGSWRERGRWAAAFLAAGALPLVAWSLLNGVRFDYYGLARGGNAIVPFYRAFISDRIVSPENGPSSRKLAAAIQQHLLTRNPYKGYHVTLDKVFTSGSFRIHEDLYLLSDEYFGWKTNYSILRKAGVEAVREHPGTYASGVAHTVWHQLSRSYFRSPPSQPVPKSATSTTSNSGLPPPTEGEPIPAGQNVWISTPDNRIRDVWTSPTQHHFVFRYPHDRARFDAIQREQAELFANLPHRRGNASLSHRLDQASRWYPRQFLWIALGVVALLWRRPRNAGVLVALALAALFVIFFNALGLFADQHFALPVDPAFVLLGACALLGPRARPSGRRA
jgi:Dolichyl-phosphate-mannose-protein mannosyltransferase